MMNEGFPVLLIHVMVADSVTQTTEKIYVKHVHARKINS